MDTEKISVIVPIYKVEPYLCKCLDSIVNQTYKNLEIILVDDGSPDGCGEICDKYAAKDERIVVIHQQNGGVSSARNAGLKIASGDWIGWVDSDDWIEPDMFKYLLENTQQYQADIAVCSRCEHYKKNQRFREWDKEKLLSKEEALKNLLENDMMQNYLWDKLWKRALFDGITFPVGKTYEDIAVMHHLFERANRVICLPEVKYHYLQRSNSIVDDVSLGNRINHYTAAFSRYEEMKEKWPQFCMLLESQCIASAVGIWCTYYANSRKIRKTYQKELYQIAEISKKYALSPRNFQGVGIAGKIVIPLTGYASCWAFLLARLCGLLYRMKHGREL